MCAGWSEQRRPPRAVSGYIRLKVVYQFVGTLPEGTISEAHTRDREFASRIRELGGSIGTRLRSSNEAMMGNTT